MSFLVQRRVRLSHMVVIFFICSHIDYFIRYTRICRIRFIDLAVRRLNKSVLVNSRITCKRVDQTDVRTLGSLDRTHSSVVGVMYITHLESGTVSGKTTRSQSGKTSLMSQLTKRVVLIHELGQLGRSEELFHCCCHRFDVDQRLRGNALLILCCHTLAHNSLQSGQTDSVLVLEKLSYRTDTAVAQMIDVIIVSDAVLKMNIIVDGSENVFLCNMLRDQVVDVTPDHALHLIDVACGFFDDACQNRIVNLLRHADLFRININDCLKVYHHIGQNLDISGSILSFYPQILSRRILDRVSNLAGNLCPFFSHNFTCERAYNIFCQDTSVYTVPEHQFLIKFITAYFRQIVASRVKEHTVDEALRAVYCKRLARTDLFVQL